MAKSIHSGDPQSGCSARTTGASSATIASASLPAFRAVGGTFLQPEVQTLYATQGLNHYISDRLSWDIDADVDVLLEELFTRFYGQARRAGMTALEGEARRLMREWTRRAIAGYWTHAGYMNWDSGLGFERWHQAKKLGLTQQALIGMASTPSLLPGRRWAAWAKDILDRGLGWYDALAAREGGIPEPVFFGVTKVPQGVGSARLAAARMQANAARAVDAGLGRLVAAAKQSGTWDSTAMFMFSDHGEYAARRSPGTATRRLSGLRALADRLPAIARPAGSIRQRLPAHDPTARQAAIDWGRCLACVAIGLL